MMIPSAGVIAEVEPPRLVERLALTTTATTLTIPDSFLVNTQPTRPPRDSKNLIHSLAGEYGSTGSK